MDDLLISKRALAQEGGGVRKRRGAPKGNQSALKHGIYARQLRRVEVKEGENLDTIVLGDEIAAMRYFIRRLIAALADATERGELMEILHELSIAMLTLTRLVRTQILVNRDQGGEMENILKQTIAELSTEWK